MPNWLMDSLGSCLAIITTLLREAREQQIIADIDFDAVARMLLGGLLSYAIGKPELIDAETALPAFPAPFRLIFRTFGRQEKFVLMKSSGPEPVRA